jgi:hypothetical protein
LALTVLTLNQSFVAISLSFAGSPIHPPPLGALNSRRTSLSVTRARRVDCPKPQTPRQALPKRRPEVRNRPRALISLIPFPCGELVLAGANVRRSAAPARCPANLAPPCACFSTLDVPNPSPEAALASVHSITPPCGWHCSPEYTRPAGAPLPSFTCFQRLSHGQNPAIEFAESPSLVLANSGDSRPLGARTRLVSGDFTAVDGSGGARNR